MSLYGLYLGNPSRDAILLLHMKRTYIGSVQRALCFFFFLKIEKVQKMKTCGMLHQDIYVYNFVLPQCLTVLDNTGM